MRHNRGFLRFFQQKSQLRSAVERRRSLRQKQIEEVRRKVDEVDADRRRQIQKLPFDDLLGTAFLNLPSYFMSVVLEALQTGTFSCLEVLRAYQEAVLKAHERTNCIALFVTVCRTRKPIERSLSDLLSSLAKLLGA